MVKLNTLKKEVKRLKDCCHWLAKELARTQSRLGRLNGETTCNADFDTHRDAMLYICEDILTGEN